MRFETARDAEKPRAIGGEESPRRPPPLRMGGRLREVPWDLAQDEIGVQATDFIAITAKVILRAAQDEIDRQVIERPGGPPRLVPPVAQDEIRTAAP